MKWRRTAGWTTTTTILVPDPVQDHTTPDGRVVQVAKVQINRTDFASQVRTVRATITTTAGEHYGPFGDDAPEWLSVLMDAETPARVQRVAS